MHDRRQEGWYQEMRKAGPERLRMYGHYLGMRYRQLPNIVWMHGGDYDPSDRAPMLALIDGLRETDPKALHSFHGARSTSARRFLGAEGNWLALSTVYTDQKAVASAVLVEYAASSLPFVFIEGQVRKCRRQ